MTILASLSYCWRHGIWFGDKNRPTCPACAASDEERRS